MVMANPLRISFNFHPYDFEHKNHIIERDDAAGQRRWYLKGVTSGIKLDGHDERMTDKCIKSFMEQANSGDILLYPDAHGIKASEDIGILTKAEVDESGNWITEYRLYDEGDGFSQGKIDKCNDIRKQLTGDPPYKKPRQKGFSIEGYIPEDGILSAEKDATGALKRRVINNVLLDGVVLVPRPAYKDSIAHAIYKALGELSPWKEAEVKKGIKEKLAEIVDSREIKNAYFQKRWEIQDAMDEMIKSIMIGSEKDKEGQLKIAFEEYTELMIGLLVSSEEIFREETPSDLIARAESPYGNTIVVKSKMDYYVLLYRQLTDLVSAIKSRGGK